MRKVKEKEGFCHQKPTENALWALSVIFIAHYIKCCINDLVSKLTQQNVSLYKVHMLCAMGSEEGVCEDWEGTEKCAFKSDERQEITPVITVHSLHQ